MNVQSATIYSISGGMWLEMVVIHGQYTVVVHVHVHSYTGTLRLARALRFLTCRVDLPDLYFLQ